MELNIITAQEGMWLTQSSLKDETLRVFSKKVYNPISEWEEVTDDYKTQWEREHANSDIEGGGEYLTEVPDDGKVYGRTHGEWVEAEKAKGDYKQLIDYTVAENTSQIEFLKTDAGEDITKYRDLIIDCIFVYDESNKPRDMRITTYDTIIATSNAICDVAYRTYYRIRIKLGNRYTSEVYFESHTNSWSNPQNNDGNQGRNAFRNINHDPEYVKLLLESTFLAGEKLTIYGR